MADPSQLGPLVRFHRKQARLTQLELGQLAGVGKTVIFDIEHGKGTIRLATLLRVLSVLGITLSLEGPLMEAFEAEARRGR